MTAQLDIDDVVAGHPRAKVELERLRAALKNIVDRDCQFFGSSVTVPFATYAEARSAFIEARELLS